MTNPVSGLIAATLSYDTIVNLDAHSLESQLWTSWRQCPSNDAGATTATLQPLSRANIAPAASAVAVLPIPIPSARMHPASAACSLSKARSAPSRWWALSFPGSRSTTASAEVSSPARGSLQGGAIRKGGLGKGKGQGRRWGVWCRDFHSPTLHWSGES